VLGVLTLGRRQRFADDELAELADVAAHLGAVLDAARLHELQSTVATTMQKSLLPPLPAVAGLRFAARYSPASRGLAVGGDWYDAFPTDSGVVLVVGDASGHDVGAVARMADLRNLLRAYAVDRDEPPSGLVSRLDRSAARLGLDATATCVVGRLQPGDGARWQLSWTSAGHLPPVLLRGGRARLLDPAPELMLGVDTSTVRTDHTLELQPGDLLLLYTDGLVEVRGASLQERLELLRAQVEDDSGLVPDLLAERLLAAIGAGGMDDVALLIVEVLP
jgi:sigma-B regulation protein RsbU (phosphoserine phosphatase)